MGLLSLRSGSSAPIFRRLLAVACSALFVFGEGAMVAQDASQAAAAEPAAEKLPPDQLDSLVAPIALYPDPLLAQTLVASTYPLEIIQLQQWLTKNTDLKDKALADAVAKQPWDPAIQSMAAVPDVVKRLADDIQWTTELGNAFLAQQNDVMDAVQRMRKKAEDKGALKSNEQQKVETKVVEKKTVIVVQPTNPEVIYVPVLQSDGRLCPAGLSLSADLLPALRPGRRVWSPSASDGDGRGHLGRLVLRLRLGRREQQHHHQQQQQLQPGTRTSIGAGTATGSTTRSTAAARPTRTRRRPASTAGRRAAVREAAAEHDGGRQPLGRSRRQPQRRSRSERQFPRQRSRCRRGCRSGAAAPVPARARAAEAAGAPGRRRRRKRLGGGSGGYSGSSARSSSSRGSSSMSSAAAGARGGGGGGGRRR